VRPDEAAHMKGVLAFSQGTGSGVVGQSVFNRPRLI